MITPIEFHPLLRLRSLPTEIALRDIDRQIRNLSVATNAHIVRFPTKRRRTAPLPVLPDGAA